MNFASHPLLRPYVGKPALLDSNLLLLYWCAQFDPALTKSFKRLNAFQPDDYDLLAEVLKVFSALRATPHVLTEVSNLANALPEWIKEEWLKFFSQRIDLIREEWMPATQIAKDEGIWLGLTDAALACLASSHVILTIDFPLSNSLEARGLNVINFTHLRTMYLA
jgi:hypothetical protein